MENIEEINAFLTFILQIVAIFAGVVLIVLLVYVYRLVKNTKSEIEYRKNEIEDQIADKLDYVQNIRFLKPNVNYALALYGLNALMRLTDNVSKRIEHYRK